MTWYHFAGVAGSGMSALAQMHAWKGGQAGGSDRAFDQGGSGGIRAALEAAGVRIHPQDGTGISPGCDALVVSTAVEESVPDVRAARGAGVPILHRSELLESFAAGMRTLAVTGTSGKSTVTAMIFEILRHTGADPSLMTGGDLISLRDAGFLGNAWLGRGPWLVMEADESDGTLVRYRPWGGVLLNLQRDHKEVAELEEIFARFRANVRGIFISGDDPNLDAFSHGAIRYGFSADSDVRIDDLEIGPRGSRFTIRGIRFELPCPGLHNVRNAAAAIAAAMSCGAPMTAMPQALASFRGVARRFQRIGSVGGVEVVDDFAHNPDKITASLAAARPAARRILAVYQPHGFGPTRFLRDDLIDALCGGLTPSDRLYMPEIFYAGGTAVKDISSRDIVDAVARRGIPAHFAERREDLIDVVAHDAEDGDMVLVMGARDPSLTGFCGEILRCLEERKAATKEG